jgi:hypothetical protein
MGKDSREYHSDGTTVLCDSCRNHANSIDNGWSNATAALSRTQTLTTSVAVEAVTDLDSNLSSVVTSKSALSELPDAWSTTEVAPGAAMELPRGRDSSRQALIAISFPEQGAARPASPRKRSHDDTATEYASTRVQPTSEVSRSVKRQRQFDEQQNTIEFRMRPSQIQKAREKIWKLIEDTALHLFTVAGCDAAKSVSLVPFGELGSQPGRLYHGVFEDPYRMIEFESEGSLSGYHVLLALQLRSTEGRITIGVACRNRAVHNGADARDAR